MSDSVKVLEEIIVTNLEMRVIEVMQKGFDKAKEIAESSGLAFSSTMLVLNELKEMNWVKWNKRHHTYCLVDGLTFRAIRLHNGLVVDDSDEYRLRNRKVLKATHRNKQYGSLNSDVVIKKWTPEQAEEHFKQLTKHMRYFEFKKGEYTPNENYHSIYGQR